MLTTLAISLVLAQTGAASAKNVEADVRFLASDALEGRGTPSPGLDKAADYIADAFKVAKLQPGGADGFFQTTDYTNRRTQATAKVRNVIGVLPGSDPELAKTYVIVTAHYDHLGKRDGEGDRLYNGANDNASGTAGVMELARIFGADKKRPKRSMIFIAFWGEEMGLRGSNFYVGSPTVPLTSIACVVNLEQIGRTDDSEGARVAEYNLTGYELSDLGDRLAAAAQPTGIKVTRHPKLSIPYFYASDNASFARKGIPAHTISVAYDFPDYHQPGDEADKLDYANEAKILNAIAKGLRAIGDSPQAIAWKADEPKAKPFIEAREKLLAGG